MFCVYTQVIQVNHMANLFLDFFLGTFTLIYIGDALVDNSRNNGYVSHFHHNCVSICYHFLFMFYFVFNLSLFGVRQVLKVLVIYISFIVINIKYF